MNDLSPVQKRVLRIITMDADTPVLEEALREMLKAGGGPPVSNRELHRTLESLRQAGAIRFMNAPNKKGWVVRTLPLTP